VRTTSSAMSNEDRGRKLEGECGLDVHERERHVGANAELVGEGPIGHGESLTLPFKG
jgi:hypothetical protein